MKEELVMATKAKAKTKKSPEEFPLGIDDLAKMLKVEPATARVKLRANNVKRTGKSYGWKTQAEMKKVADKLVAA